MVQHRDFAISFKPQATTCSGQWDLVVEQSQSRRFHMLVEGPDVSIGVAVRSLVVNYTVPGSENLHSVVRSMSARGRPSDKSRRRWCKVLRQYQVLRRLGFDLCVLQDF